MGSNFHLPYSTKCIDKADDLNNEVLTFEKIRKKFGTFRSIRVSDGRLGEKRYKSRSGVQTDYGDIEESVWKALVLKLIRDSGEHELFNKLLIFVKKKHNHLDNKEKEALAVELHAARIFDDPKWFYFISFNSKYRPETLDSADIIRVKTECCNKPALVTKQQIEWNKHYNAVPCPICGKLSEYSALSEKEVDFNGIS